MRILIRRLRQVTGLGFAGLYLGCRVFDPNLKQDYDKVELRRIFGYPAAVLCPTTWRGQLAALAGIGILESPEIIGAAFSGIQSWTDARVTDDLDRALDHIEAQDPTHPLRDDRDMGILS